ncbi:hypothetical protein, partial [Ochrobactrum sp. CGA5]|uniref:hypothetical protein n=1 Tax=Ochrobactrum sp. CGA5 TaxID=2583453 RepID=UPI001FFE713D
RFSLRQQNIDLAQLRDDLFGFVLLLGHSNVLLRLNSLLQGGPLFRGQTNDTLSSPDIRRKVLESLSFRSAAVEPLGLIPSYIISGWLWEGGLQQPLPNA